MTDGPRASAVSRFFAELKRRHVFGVAIMYGIAGVGVIEAVDVIFPRIPLPDWTISFVVWVVLLGFPLALLFAWFFEIDPGGGVRRTPDVDPATLDAIAAQPARRRWPIGLAGAAGGALVVAAAWITLGELGDASIRGRGAAGAGSSAADGQSEPTVVVLPFSVTGADTTVWGTGMVAQLSSTLDEVPGLRAIHPSTASTYLKDFADGESTEEGVAGALGAATGARYAITGTSVQAYTDGDLRLAARVYDVATGTLLGTARVDGEPSTRLVDRLTIQLLREGLLPVQGDPPEVTLARISSQSLPATKAYLEGEDAYRRGKFGEAVQRYREAVELDSTFARAWLRLAQSYTWRDLESWEQAGEAFDRAKQFSSNLSTRDRRLVEASGSKNIELKEQYTKAYADDPDGWFALADALFHQQPFRHPGEYRRAFARAIRVAPHYWEAYFHSVDDAVVHLDRKRVAEYAAAYDTLQEAGVGCPGLRWLHDVRWGRPPEEQVAARAIEEAQYEDISCLWLARAAVPRMMDVVKAALLDREELAAIDLWGMLGTRLYTGRAADAAGVLRRAAREYGYPGFEAGNRLMMHLAGYLHTDDTERWVRVLQRESMDPNRVNFAPNLFWIAALALEEGRTDDFDATVTSLDSLARATEADDPDASRRTAFLSRALTEYSRLQSGQWGRLQAFEEAIDPLRITSLTEEFPVHYMRFEIGKLLLEAGQFQEAERYLLSIYPFASPYVVPAQFYLGRAYEAMDRPDEARNRYLVFSEWWTDADSHLLPMRQEALEAIQRLAPDR